MSKTRTAALLFVSALMALSAVCSSTQVAHSKATTTTGSTAPSVQLPQIPENAVPNTGSVVEYWPDGQKKSERLYKSGKLVTAVYFASDGRRVYEMAESTEGR